MSVTVSEIKSLYNPKIIDIRTNDVYNQGHIPGAQNIGYNDLVISPNKYLNKEETYYIYCKKGITSRSLATLLNKQGYKVKSIIGGYDAWLKN